MDTLNKVMTILVGLVIVGLLAWKVCTYTPPKGKARPT
jgi:hypothetical protein